LHRIVYEHAFVPDKIVNSYGRRLMSLGFEKEAGACFHKAVK